MNINVPYYEKQNKFYVRLRKKNLLLCAIHVIMSGSFSRQAKAATKSLHYVVPTSKFRLVSCDTTKIDSSGVGRIQLGTSRRFSNFAEILDLARYTIETTTLGYNLLG